MAAVTIWVGLTAISIFLFFFNPSSPANQWFPKCPFRLVTGFQCPGCGSTRAFYQLLPLHPVAAFKFNPLIMLTLPFLIYGFGICKKRYYGTTLSPFIHPPIYLWAWLVLMIFFWIFRNTPWYPFGS